MATLIVGIGDMKVARNPDTVTTLGLGSCVGVTLYDKNTQIGGLVHIMLPSSKGYDISNRAKYADLAIEDLIKAMRSFGARTTGLVAKMAGGAHMFSGSANNVLMVGDRNVAACKEMLGKLGLSLQAADTGGVSGRTIELITATGMLRIRTVGGGERLI
jgi:chemotaxis protein CheD